MINLRKYAIGFIRKLERPVLLDNDLVVVEGTNYLIVSRMANGMVEEITRIPITEGRKCIGRCWNYDTLDNESLTILSYHPDLDVAIAYRIDRAGNVERTMLNIPGDHRFAVPVVGSNGPDLLLLDIDENGLIIPTIITVPGSALGIVTHNLPIIEIKGTMRALNIEAAVGAPNRYYILFKEFIDEDKHVLCPLEAGIDMEKDCTRIDLPNTLSPDRVHYSFIKSELILCTPYWVYRLDILKGVPDRVFGSPSGIISCNTNRDALFVRAGNTVLAFKASSLVPEMVVEFKDEPDYVIGGNIRFKRAYAMANFDRVGNGTLIIYQEEEIEDVEPIDDDDYPDF